MPRNAQSPKRESTISRLVALPRQFVEIPQIEIPFDPTKLLGALSTNGMFGIFIVLFFIVTSGVIYNAINKAPREGMELNTKTGKYERTIISKRLGSQYSTEGYLGATLYTVCSLGALLFIVVMSGWTPRGVPTAVLPVVGLVVFAVAFWMLQALFRAKAPFYLK
eukprot:gnl/Chilomastix_cuspidata/1846.p2 GENE.gnl/Chilomastix_cuspidata/1846~~gnl/Chilomastix_cuspidata/1846.p2  ORF type:complete len:172 (+),score=50.35 gnl/Chilomastix_cuspidata/1846:24-518(+)